MNCKLNLCKLKLGVIMAIGQKDMINSLSHLLDWLEREKN